MQLSKQPILVNNNHPWIKKSVKLQKKRLYMNLCSWHHKKYQNYKAQRLYIKDNVATVTSHTRFQFLFFKAGAFSIFSRHDKRRITLRTENPKDMAHSVSQLNQKVGLSYAFYDK